MANFDDSYEAIYNAAAQYISNPGSAQTVVFAVRPFVETIFPQIKKERDFFALRKSVILLMRKIGRSGTRNVLAFLRTLEIESSQISYTDCIYAKLTLYITEYIKNNADSYWWSAAKKLLDDLSLVRDDLAAIQKTVAQCCNRDLVSYLFRNSPTLKPDLEEIIKLIPEDPGKITDWDVIPRYSEDPIPADRREYSHLDITDNTSRDELLGMIGHLLATNEKLTRDIMRLEIQLAPGYERIRTPNRDQVTEEGFVVVNTSIPRVSFSNP